LFLARIDGWVTSTVKHRSLGDMRLLIGQRIGEDDEAIGEPMVLLDTLGARLGSRVVVTSDGDLARELLKDNRTPSRMVVLGLVDEVHVPRAGRGDGSLM
jgi:ethanolamine utilization protein EutN